MYHRIASSHVPKMQRQVLVEEDCQNEKIKL
jgi:hypothetical protein